MTRIGIFTDEDFYFEDCDEIDSIILEEAKSFVSFMQMIIEEIVGKEDILYNILNGKTDDIIKNMAPKKRSIMDDDDDEDI